MTGTRRWGGSLAVMAMLAVGFPARADMELNGAIATENYVGVKEGEIFNFRNANLFRLKVKAKPSENVAGFADLELRNTNFTQVETVGDLWDRGSVDPVSWRVNEAYADLYGFLLDTDWAVLDLRVGKQIVAWGEADGFNPTNNFDPYNLENPLDFKEHLGNVALKAAFNFGDDLLMVEGVVAPRFLPSVLPVDLFLGDDPLNNPLMPAFPPELLQLLGEGNELVPPGNELIRTVTPAWEAENIMAGTRVKWSLFDIDMSLSYFHGRDTLPSLSRTTGHLGFDLDQGCPNEPQAGGFCVVITDVELVYTRLDVVGFDFRADLWDVGVWGEVGVFFPEGLTASTDINAFDGGNLFEQKFRVIDDEPYAKWTLGAEYTFTGGWYFNLQWVHGFFTERTGHALHDYLFLVFRKSFLSDRLKFELTLGGELDTSLGRNALGGLVSVLMSYQPFDGADVSVGYVMARGESGTTLEVFEPLDQVYLKVKVEF